MEQQVVEILGKIYSKLVDIYDLALGFDEAFLEEVEYEEEDEESEDVVS